MNLDCQKVTYLKTDKEQIEARLDEIMKLKGLCDCGRCFNFRVFFETKILEYNEKLNNNGI